MGLSFFISTVITVERVRNKTQKIKTLKVICTDWEATQHQQSLQSARSSANFDPIVRFNVSVVDAEQAAVADSRVSKVWVAISATNCKVEFKSWWPLVHLLKVWTPKIDQVLVLCRRVQMLTHGARPTNFLLLRERIYDWRHPQRANKSCDDQRQRHKK
jgi:hypothetical protein